MPRFKGRNCIGINENQKKAGTGPANKKIYSQYSLACDLVKLLLNKLKRDHRCIFISQLKQ
ncbi:MAG: hypothetical protein ABI761_06505, partial [Saprospiraceae bacterium]